LPDSEFLDKYYNKDYMSYKTSSVAEQRLATRIQEIECNYFGCNTGSMLDIGASNGGLVKAALDRGWDAWGIEPYGIALKDTPSYVRDRIYEGYLNKTFSKWRKYDLITMWDVIEHVPNPREIIRISSELLKPNGVFIICTPNFASIGRLLAKASWGPILEPSHLSFWTPAMFRQAFPGFDLRIISMYSSGNPVGFNVGQQTGVSRPDLLQADTKKSTGLTVSGTSTSTSISPAKFTRRQLGRLKSLLFAAPHTHALARTTIRLLALGDNVTAASRKQ
jgi:SAM-dependent methyltransferase